MIYELLDIDLPLLSELDRWRSFVHGITSFWGHSVRLRQSKISSFAGNSFELSLFFIRHGTGQNIEKSQLRKNESES